MAVNYYATEAELEAKMGLVFTATSQPTSTQVVGYLTQWSAALDALMGQAEQYYGNSGACPEWTKQAVLNVVAMLVEGIRAGTPSLYPQTLAYLNLLLQQHLTRDLSSSITTAIPQLGLNDDDEVYDE